MVPVAHTAVSLFGAPLGVAPILNSMTGAASSLITGLNSTSGSAAGSAVVGGTLPGSNELSSAVSVTASGGGAAPFADLFTQAIGQVEQLEGQARSSVEGLMSGKGVDVHEAMIATEKSEMGFELVLSVRNKALSAYQQVMGMQF